MKKIVFIISIFILLIIGCDKEPVLNINWQLFDMLNSNIPNNYITSITIDGQGNKWIGTNSSGFAKFDGSSWTKFNTSNSGLPDNHIQCIAVDKQENVWIGTTNKGLIKYDGIHFTIYNTNNSDLPHNTINCIAIDKEGNKWIGTKYGLANIKDTVWSVYTPMGILASVDLIAIDKQDNVWIGSHDPILAKYDGTNWNYYYYYSLISDVNSSCLTADEYGNIWIGGINSATNTGYIVKFDGNNFTLFDHSNSILSKNGVKCIVSDVQSNIWVEFSNISSNPNVLKFGTVNSIGYSTSNLPVDNFNPSCIVIDNLNNKWIGSNKGLFLFNENGIKY
jgi:ligand-binding sensor domain-containing protein